MDFREATNQLNEETFQALYGPWEPLGPQEIAEQLSAGAFRWWVAGGRAARVGAPPRRHEDTDVTVLASDAEAVRQEMSGWHLWENVNGTLRPLLPGIALNPVCEQLWVRRDSRRPWRMEFLIDRCSTGEEWVFKRNRTVRLPWERAAHTVDGINYMRPEVALLYKAHLDRAKDRADLGAARLDPAGRTWLASTLEQLGHGEWARLARLPR